MSVLVCEQMTIQYVSRRKRFVCVRGELCGKQDIKVLVSMDVFGWAESDIACV